MSKRKMMDALAGLSDASGSGSDSDDEPAAAAPAKRTAAPIELAALEQHGYKGGPSVLFVPEQSDGPGNWNWSSGMERKGDEPAVEGFDERQRNRDAVTTGAEESAALSKLATEQQNRLKRGRREEAIQHKKELKKGTWKEKEKAKRDKGQQNRGKSTVEEEKRKARECGVYSGFD